MIPKNLATKITKIEIIIIEDKSNTCGMPKKACFPLKISVLCIKIECTITNIAIVTIVAPIPESLTITKPVKKAKKPVRVSDISAEESASNSKAFNPHGASGRDNF